MNANFPRILTFLRKERGISQKEAAAALQVSQALLSHYEKGIRECGLDFVVRAADFYGVSCDYLLGRTADKSGAIIAVDDIPESDGKTADSHLNGSVLPILNKKLIFNAITVIFDLLQRYDSKPLTDEVARYFDIAVYTLFRALYAADAKNPESLFSVPPHLYAPQAFGRMALSCASIPALVKDAAAQCPKNAAVSLIPDDLARQYPLFASSLLALLKNAESSLS